MKAYIYAGRDNLKILDVEKPLMPERGALAKIRYSSICGTDLRTYRFGNKHIATPRIIGHEALYVLEDVSPEFSTEFHRGDRVIVAPAIGCGNCPSCKRGKTNMCQNLTTVGFSYDGTFAEYCAIPGQAFLMNNVIKIKDKIKDIEACVAEPIACAINGQSFLDIRRGENVLIFGGGFLGCIHAELALLKGANIVIIAEISASRREQAQKAIPEIFTLDASLVNLSEEIISISTGEGCDVVITACPVGRTHSQALDIINKNGRVSLFGGLPGESIGFLDSNLIHYKELGVFGVHASTPQQNLEALNFIADGIIQVEKYLSIFPFNEIEQAFIALINETAVKALMEF